MKLFLEWSIQHERMKILGEKLQNLFLTNYILMQHSCKNLPDLMFCQKIYSKSLCLIKNVKKINHSLEEVYCRQR